MNERLGYIIDFFVNKQRGRYSLEGINEEGWWYVAGRLSDGTCLSNVLWPLRDVKIVRIEPGKIGTIGEAIRAGVSWETLETKLTEYMNSLRISVRPVNLLTN